LLQRGVELWIAYGLNEAASHGRSKVKDEDDREAERKLRRLGDDYADLLHMTRLGDTTPRSWCATRVFRLRHHSTALV
jgi:hypothetical protein